MANALRSALPLVAGELPPTLTVPSRFRGPKDSANGGYLCGRVAGYLDGEVLASARTVWLTVPRPAVATTAEEAS